jgi:putative inorganic carbon (HCO3(-)) transporter
MSSNPAAVVLCVAASVALGLMIGTTAGRQMIGPVGSVVLFVLLLWDIRLVVPLLIFMLPFGPKYPMAFGNLYVSTVILIITYAAWVVRMPATRRGFSLRWNGVLLWALALIVTFALSSLQNLDHLLHNQPAFLKFVQFLLYTGIFVLVYQMDFSRSQIRYMLVAVLLTGVAEGVIGSVQWITHPGLYVHGTIDYGHNLFAIYMAFVILLMLGVVTETRKWAVRLAGIAALAVMVYSLVFAFSRTAYVAMLVSFATFALVPMSRAKRIIIPTATLALAAILILVVPLTVFQRMGDIVHTATGANVAVSYKVRTVLWRQAFSDFLKNPLIGRGAWAYGMQDNFFVKAGAEAGLLGLGSFLVLIWVILRASWRSAAAHPRDDVVRGVAVGFVPATVGCLIVFNITGDFMTVSRFIGVFWIALALLLRYMSDYEGPSAGAPAAIAGTGRRDR